MKKASSLRPGHVMCSVKMTGDLLLLLAVMLATRTIVADVPAADGEFDGAFDDAAAAPAGPSREALRRLFDKYGGRDSGRITFEGFEHLLESLGLGHVVMVDHDVHDHQTDDGGFRSLHDHHVHTDAQAARYRDRAATTSHDHGRRRRRRRRRRRSADDARQSARDGTTVNISQVRIVAKILTYL